MSSALSRALLQPRTALIAALLLELWLYFAVQADFAASDPLAYAVIAYDFAAHPAKAFAAISHHPFEMRIGLTMPLALLYHLFGVSTPVTNLPCLAAWLLIVLVVYAAIPTRRGKLLGLFFVVTSRPLVQHAMLLNADLLCSALMACSVLGLAHRDRRRGAWWLVGAAVALIAAFLVKETALWLGPIWIYALALDARALGLRPTLRRFAPGLATGLALAAAYLLFCAWLWGDPLARFRGVQQLADVHTWSLSHASGKAWLARLLWGPPQLLFKMSWLALFPALLAPWLVRGPQRLWVFATCCIALLFWFGSSSLSSYSPLPLVPRMALPILPGLFVLAALSLDRLLERWLPPAAATDRPPARWKLPALLLALAAYAFSPVAAIAARVHRPRPQTELYAALRADLADPTRRFVILSGDRNRNELSRYYFQFDPPPHVTFVFAGDYPLLPAQPGATVLVLVDVSPNSRHSGDPATDVTAQLEALKLPQLRARGTLHLHDGGDGTQLRAAMTAAASTKP